MLRWSLEHPTAGQIVLERGSDAEFSRLTLIGQSKNLRAKKRANPTNRGRVLVFGGGY